MNVAVKKIFHTSGTDLMNQSEVKWMQRARHAQLGLLAELDHPDARGRGLEGRRVECLLHRERLQRQRGHLPRDLSAEPAVVARAHGAGEVAVEAFVKAVV